MRFTQGALGMLVQRYRGILKKCHLLNVLGGAVVSALLLGGANMAFAAAPIAISDSHQVADGATETYTTIDVNNGGTLGIARNAKVTGSDVTVNTGGILASVKNLHFGSFNPEPSTGLLADSLTVNGGTVTGSHRGLSTGGTVDVSSGSLALETLDLGQGQMSVSGGTLKMGNLSIANDKLVGSATTGALALNNNGQIQISEVLSITGGNFANTLAGGIQAGSLVLDSGRIK